MTLMAIKIRGRVKFITGATPIRISAKRPASDDASGCGPAEDVKSLQPRIDGVAQKHDIFQAATKYNHGNKNEEQLAKANDAREKVQSAIGFGGEERPLRSFANNDGDRPEQNGQKHEQQISTHDRVNETLARVPRNSLAFINRGERKHFADIAGRIAAKGNFLRTINLAVNKRSDLAPFLCFSALIFHSFDGQDAFLVAAHAELVEQRQQS